MSPDELPEVPDVPEEPDDDGEVELLPDDAPEPLDMPEPDDEDVPMSLEPDERVPVELHAASEMAQASSTIHLDINFSF